MGGRGALTHRAFFSARSTWGEGPTVDRKRKRLQEEKLALDDKGYLRADLRVSRIYHFDEPKA